METHVLLCVSWPGLSESRISSLGSHIRLLVSEIGHVALRDIGLTLMHGGWKIWLDLLFVYFKTYFSGMCKNEQNEKK